MSRLHLVRLPGAAALLAETRDVLARDLADEARHSLLLGAALARADAAPLAEAPDGYFAVVREGAAGAGAGAIRVVAYQEPPFPLLLVAPGKEPDPAVGPAFELVAGDLAAAGRVPEAIHLAAALAPAFAAGFASAWAAVAGREARLAMRQRLHALAAVAPVAEPAGRMRRAERGDLPLVVEWAIGFGREVEGEAEPERVRRQVERRVGAGEVWLWEEAARPRAMAATARRTGRTVTVNAVYTPPAERGRGWATGLVAALSRRELAAGAGRCVLFTDLANPTSNAIYARIGYRPIGDFLLYRLEAPAAPS
ncbi:MAG TPA: GNAT family N-acetyltransferase [Gemmatimonadales bacterium]|nr:GNAT family N-acetyltransferase [Gemmatimonadales bacterium]